jgi:hypothetical protein
MVKTLTDRFKIGKSKEKKLDLVTAVSEKNYDAKFNEIYSTAQRDREKYEGLLNRYSEGKILKQEKKKTGFNNYIKRGIATLGLIGYLAGCEPLVKTGNINVTVGDKNYKPNAELQVSPEYAKVGEEVSISASGTDENGIEDIKEYHLGIDENKNGLFELEEMTTDYKPIQLKKTFSESGEYKLYSKCVDKAGEFSEVEKKLNIYAPEIPIDPTLPTVDFSGLDKTLVDGRTKTITLPAPTDADTEGEILYNSVRSLDDKVSATLNGRELTLTAIPVSEETNYQLEFDFGTEQGGKNKATLEGKIENLCDISGDLQDNETDSNQEGEIRLYNKDKIKLAETNTSDGVFNVQASEPASEIYLQAKVGDNGYIRTITLDGSKDYSGKMVRAVSEPDFETFGGNPKADFKEFLRRTNFGFRRGDLYGGLKRWNFGEEEDGTIFQGLEILDKDPNTGAQFTQAQQELIEQYIKESGYLRGGEINIQQDDEGSEKHYVKNSDGTTSALKGWGIIIPARLDSNIAGLTDTYDTNGDNYIDRYKIRLDTNHIDSRIIIHEFLHGMIYFGHSHEEEDNKVIESLMAYNGGDATSMTEADIKGNYVIEELTYPVKSDIEEILGMNWMN